MNTYHSRIRAAELFLSLGMYAVVKEKLDHIKPKDRSRREALILRLRVYHELQRWDLMEAAAKQLCKMDSRKSQWRVSLAYASRRSQNLKAARKILLAAVAKFPDSALIHFNIACYEAQLGNLPKASEELTKAAKLDPDYKAKAWTDPDLEPLRSTLGQDFKE